MKYSIFILSIIALISVFDDCVFAQPELWDIYTTSSQPYIDVVVYKYESDSLYIKFMDETAIFHQDSISHIVKENKSQTGLGFLVGAVFGGLLLNAGSQGEEGIFGGLGRLSAITLGALMGGALGGLIGSAAGADTRYKLTTMDTEVKRKLLSTLFN